MEIFVSKKIPPDHLREWKEFLQQITNRRTFGHQRYETKREHRYMSRLAEELKVYKKTGNKEQLLNIAVYAFLESVAPENKHFHFDPTVDSATRKKYGS